MRLFFGKILLGLLITASAFAGINEDFHELKDSGTDFTVIGTICEEVARLDIKDVYPPNRYQVHTGIQYASGKSVLGELDIVVIENKTNKAVLVGEVKCWKNLNGAHNKAMEQRQRFLKHIHSDAKLNFRSANFSKGESFHQDQFEGIQDFIAIAQKGSEDFGFDDELEYSLEELMELRQRIISCQKQHRCVAPN